MFNENEKIILEKMKMNEEIFEKYPFIIIPSTKPLAGIIHLAISKNVKWKRYPSLNFSGVWLIHKNDIVKAQEFVEKESLEMREYKNFIIYAFK